MLELRLLDPDGYTVPGTVHTNVPATDEAKIRDRLLNEVAPQDAAQWTAWGFKCDARDYRVSPDPAT